MKPHVVTAFAIAASLLAAPIPAAAQDKARVFKPVGQWAVDYGDDYCRLARNFSDGSDTLALAVERIQPGPMARMVLMTNAIKPFRSAEEIGWHFTPSDPERKARFTHAPTADGPEYYNLGQFMVAPSSPPAPGTTPAPPPPYDRQKEQAAAKGMTGFVLDTGLNTPVEVDTGDLVQPIAALQKCADDLAGTWGLDPAKLQSEKSPPMPEGGGANWLPQGTIAFTDFAKLAGGSNQVRLMVDATGKPTSCAVHWATLDATTNDKICKTLMAKAKFTPATDAAGQPMSGYWVGNPMFLGPPMKGFGRR
jgi:hypothetical protein